MIGSPGVGRNRRNIIELAKRLGTGWRPVRAADAGYGKATAIATGIRGDLGRMNRPSLARKAHPAAAGCAGGTGAGWAVVRTAAAVVALGLLLGGCFLSETYQRGYIVPDGALEQIPIGSSQEQVLIVLGTPS